MRQFVKQTFYLVIVTIVWAVVYASFFYTDPPPLYFYVVTAVLWYGVVALTKKRKTSPPLPPSTPHLPTKQSAPTGSTASAPTTSPRRSRTIFLALSLLGLALVAGVLYWQLVRPAQARVACQAEVDRAIEHELRSEGFFHDASGRWVRGVTYYTWTGPPDPIKPPTPDPLTGRINQFSNIDALFTGGPAEMCRSGESTDAQCNSTQSREPIDPDWLLTKQNAAQELYKPCLRRRGLPA